MEDVFYFTQSVVTLGDIAKLAEMEGYECEYVGGEASDLRIRLESHYESMRVAGPDSSLRIKIPMREYWQFGEWGERWWDALEPEQLQRVRSYSPVASYMISYHTPTLAALGGFLKRVLQRYGGWVACDDEWTITYDAETIERIQCG